jgi:hypothetical protein
MRTIIRHLRRAVLLRPGDGPTDAQLLESFLTRRDEAAFEALLLRHGPMVLGVCSATPKMPRTHSRLLFSCSSARGSLSGRETWSATGCMGWPAAPR